MALRCLPFSIQEGKFSLFSIPRSLPCSQHVHLGRRFIHTVHSDRPPFRVAVIGSGPAGFYAASKLIAKSDDAIVDMYEQLPVPFGLVRFGVAPDHPEVKVWRSYTPLLPD